MASLFLLYESWSCYALFKVQHVKEINQNWEDVRNFVINFDRFESFVKLHSFHPFTSSLDALTQWKAFSCGTMTDELRAVLETNLPKVKNGKKVKFSLGVSDPRLGLQISEVTKIPCLYDEFVSKLLRGVKIHIDRFVHDLKFVDFKYSFELEELEFNVNSVDDMVIQEIFHLTTLDKDVNSISMKFREWYSQHFPELENIVNDNYQYAKVAKFIEDKSKLSEDKISDLSNIIGDEDKATEIVEAAKASRGRDLFPTELISFQEFAQRTMNLIEDRRNLYNHLVSKMND